MTTTTKRRSNGPGKPKGYRADTPNRGSKLEQILDIIRNPKNPPADLEEVAARAKRRKKFAGVAPSRSLLYKVRRYLTDDELATYFPGAEG